MTRRAKTITYWTTTGLIAFFIGGGGVAQLAQFWGNPHGVVPVLRYPMYFFGILGFWKVLGAIAILVPRFPRLKEWAYAGFFFVMSGAACSHLIMGNSFGDTFPSLLSLVLVLLSWYFRPGNRKLILAAP